MKINEILDKAVDFEVTESTPEFFQAEFQSNGRTIVFNADKMFDYGDDDDDDDGNSRPSKAEWEISFVERLKDGSAKWDKTRGGKEFEVFATIKKIIELLISKHAPEVIIFTSDKSEGNRAELYSKLLAKQIPKGFKVIRDDSPKNVSSFRLEKIK